jgi:ATP-dependent DNA helicase RecG
MASNLQEISIRYTKGVGPARTKAFANLGVTTIEELLYFFPRRYEDRSRLIPIFQLQPGECQTVTGKILAQGSRRSWYTKKHVSEVVIDDGSGRMTGVWFNQPYLENYFKAGTRMVLYGRVEKYQTRLQMVSPEYEVITSDDENLNMGRIVPIYPLTRGITQRYLRKVIRSSLDHFHEDLRDILPVWLRNKHRLYNIRHSLENIHFPESWETQEAAHRRISFEEFFLFQISVMKRRISIMAKSGVAHQIDLDLVNRFKAGFPFALTKAQERVILEIAQDMQEKTPMLRLLQGDVGSGKTLVALFGCVAAADNGYQAALMAPTEILARQHATNIRRMLDQGYFKNLRTALLISGLKKKEKDILYEQTARGQVDILIGTHALLSEDVSFKKLSLVIIDEQHKFGVKQRALLSTKGGNPDVLIMTATPIPRTLTLTLYGDLDISILDELPEGRGRVLTRRFRGEQEEEVYHLVRQAVQAGRQAYVIYPIIEESEKLDLKAAEAMSRQFQKKTFSDFRVGLLHGQMPKEEADTIMKAFQSGNIDILVATTVLEVGIDVPNASVMVIEHAERFGLAQLHQLRGRIGRGKADGQCLLIADPVTEEAKARLGIICSTVNGFKIAEEDLMIRGPGHFFGRHQHGLNELRYANPALEVDILQMARQEAEELLHRDRDLKEDSNRILKDIIHERYPNYLSMATAG